MTILEGRLTPEGRVVVPAAVRRQLGAGPGDRLLFVSDEQGRVRLTTPHALAAEVWARNHGGDAGDAGRDVRDMRDEDVEKELAADARQAEEARQDRRTDEQVTADLFRSLGVTDGG